jgi:hypothetical protein
MAKVRPGGLMGQLSGAVGSVVFSHNRFGSYVRARVKPVVSGSSYSLIQRGCFAAVTSAWKNLTSAQQKAWSEWAQTNQITDRVGQKQVLDGHTAYNMLNVRLQADTQALLDDPPVASAQDNPGAEFTFDIGAGNFEVSANAALPSGCKLSLWACVVGSAGINYAKNPLSIQSEFAARFGTLQVGQKVIVSYGVFDTNTGLYSGFLSDSGLIVST